jgi:hypothetical protein
MCVWNFTANLVKILQRHFNCITKHTLGVLSRRSTFSVLVGTLFKKFSLFLNTVVYFDMKSSIRWHTNSNRKWRPLSSKLWCCVVWLEYTKFADIPAACIRITLFMQAAGFSEMSLSSLHAISHEPQTQFMCRCWRSQTHQTAGVPVNTSFCSVFHKQLKHMFQPLSLGDDHVCLYKILEGK